MKFLSSSVPLEVGFVTSDTILSSLHQPEASRTCAHLVNTV